MTDIAEKKSDILEAPPNPPAITLDQVADYYHKKLYDHPEALNFLKQKGLNTPALYARFKIGFADQSLSKKLSSEQITELKEAGLIRSNGQEHFLNCLTFPLLDENDRTVNVYGKTVNKKILIKHLYLKGNHQGIFNRKAAKVFDHIILTDSILEALSLMELGIDNVQPLHGIKGLTQEHLTNLKDNRIKQIILALRDNRDSKKKTDKVLKALTKEGFTVQINFPKLESWNDVLTQNKPLEEIKQEVQAQLQLAEPNIPDPIETARQGECIESSFFGSSRRLFTKIEKDKLGVIFHTKESKYKVTGIKELFVSSLKVGIKAEQSEIDENTGEKEIYYDSLDLYSAKSRGTYSRNLGRLFSLDPRKIEKDLIGILEYLETERDKNLELNKEDKKKKSLDPEDVKLGMDFLKSPDLFKEIDQDLEILGYAGEELNKQLLYLAASSRITNNPISVIIQSQSAAGKSLLVETLIKLLPPEDVISITSLSDQALNYAEDLKHKFLSLGEAVHSETIEHQIREMLSSKRLSRLVTIKDDKTGNLISKPVVTEAIVSTVITAAGYKVNPENASRCFLLIIDESPEQTRRIHQSQRNKYSLKRLLEKQELVPRIIRKHQAAQRLLKQRTIFNPYAEHLDFPSNLVRTRRDHDRFMDLIACVCFLRQYQKEIKIHEDTEYIECDLIDYSTAYWIMVKGVLSSSLSEIPQGTRDLYEVFRELARKEAYAKKQNPEEISFTQREIRELTGFGHSWVKQHLRRLVQYEYIVLYRGGTARSKGCYRLVKDEDMEDLNLSMIPTPKAIARRTSLQNKKKSK